MTKYAIIDNELTHGAFQDTRILNCDRADAIKEANSEWEHMTKHDRDKCDSFILALVEVLTDDDGAEMDGDVIEVIRDYKAPIYTAVRETGDIIDRVDTIGEGLREIYHYEAEDKANGDYEPDFYDIVNENHESMIFYDFCNDHY